MRSRGLNPKHKKAMELLQQGELSIPDVAKQAGLSRDHLYDLISGRERAGGVAEDFSKMYQKVIEDADKRITMKQKAIKETVAEVLENWTRINKSKELDQSERKSYVDIAKVLQVQPTYNIGSVSYSRGLTPEEMLNEFKRLRAASEGALVRGSVLSAVQGGSGVLPASSRGRVEAENGQEDPSLPAQP